MPIYSVSDTNRILLSAARMGDLEQFDFALENGADITYFTEPHSAHATPCKPEIAGTAGFLWVIKLLKE